MGYPEVARSAGYREEACLASSAAMPAIEIAGARSGVVPAILWAGLASTLHRIRRGEGALLAVNLSLVAYAGLRLDGVAQAIVSILAIVLMYAFNDLYDAPADVKNPKKDRALTAVYLSQRGLCAASILVFKALTLALAFVTLGERAALAVAAAFVVNLVYSTALKGVPVLDVLWCGLWGAVYAAIVTESPSILILVAIMTAVCHLYQALDDRASDAENHITTTAVRSQALSRNVLLGLSIGLFLVLRGPLGAAWACTAFVPLALFFGPRPLTGWLLSKVYFAIVWLYLLGSPGATG